MPSTLPKITAYCDQETFDVFTECAAALGTSRSALVVELMQSSVPMLRVLTDSALVVKTRGDVQRSAFEKAAADLAPYAAESEQLLGQVLSIMRDAGEGPPPSNTGVSNP